MSDRVAIVTGAASGLGRAVAAHLRGDGWRVAGFDLASPTDEDIHDVAVDIADDTQVMEAVATTVSDLGRLDALINCAGIFIEAMTAVEVFTRAGWDRTIAVNLTAPFLLARACLPHLRETAGAAVFIASTAARVPTPGASAYAASKAGVVALAKTIALEYGGFGVRANAISPGFMNTPMAAAALDQLDTRAAIEAGIPIHRVAEPAEVAALAGFLVSDAGRYITGQEIMFDGAKAISAFVEPADVERMWRRAGRLRTSVSNS